MSGPTFLGTVAALVGKDLLSEWRTREVLGSGVVFGLLILVVFNFAFDLRVDNAEDVAPGVLWVAFIFAGMLGIGRTFAVERDRGTLDALLLAPIERGAIYVAKMISNTVLMAVVEVVCLPAFVGLFDVRIAWLDMAAVTTLGTLGFTGVGTLVAAIATTTRSREVILPLLLFPLEVPVVIASVKATALAVGARPAEPLPWLQLLAAFDVILVAASYIVFEYIIED